MFVTESKQVVSDSANINNIKLNFKLGYVDDSTGHFN
jgi:hypothetical protein